MNNSVQLIVFDIAGTTVKDNGEIVFAFQQAMKESGYEIPEEKIEPLKGYKKTDAIRKMLEAYEPDAARITQEFINTIHERFLQLMIEHYSTTAALQPLPNAEDVFAYCKRKGIKVGLDTGFSNDITNVIIERLGWVKDGKVDYVVSSNEVPAGRPQPYMIQKMMQMAGNYDNALKSQYNGNDDINGVMWLLK